jgi:hypothetical protein
VVSLRIEELEELIQRRLCILDRLERAMARLTVSGDVPTHWVPKVSTTACRVRNRHLSVVETQINREENSCRHAFWASL